MLNFFYPPLILVLKERREKFIAWPLNVRTFFQPDVKVPKTTITENKKMDPELSMLVKSVRRKAQEIKRKKSFPH